jgi:uncharacterized protein
MSTALLEDARNYLIEFLRGKPNAFETKHLWRKDWEFAVLHSLRVEAYVLKILAAEAQRLSESEVGLLRLAAILHDLGRIEMRAGHAQRGAEIASEWLGEHTAGILTGAEVERVVDLIAVHSNKSEPDPDFSKAVLKDADTLDEIGVMSIFMSANWIEAQSPFFFHHLKQRLIEYELPFCERKMGILNTQGAKEILRAKKAFIEGFIAQMSDELECDGPVDRLMAERLPGEPTE